MLTTIEGFYEGGKIILTENPPVMTRTKVMVTFLTETKPSEMPKRKLGGLEGKVKLPDNFNEPLEELSDYM